VFGERGSEQVTPTATIKRLISAAEKQNRRLDRLMALTAGNPDALPKILNGTSRSAHYHARYSAGWP
jgi:hypothetical protein